MYVCLFFPLGGPISVESYKVLWAIFKTCILVVNYKLPARSILCSSFPKSYGETCINFIPEFWNQAPFLFPPPQPLIWQLHRQDGCHQNRRITWRALFSSGSLVGKRQQPVSSTQLWGQSSRRCRNLRGVLAGTENSAACEAAQIQSTEGGRYCSSALRRPNPLWKIFALNLKPHGEETTWDCFGSLETETAPALESWRAGYMVCLFCKEIKKAKQTTERRRTTGINGHRVFSSEARKLTISDVETISAGPVACNATWCCLRSGVRPRNHAEDKRWHWRRKKYGTWKRKGRSTFLLPLFPSLSGGPFCKRLRQLKSESGFA